MKSESQLVSPRPIYGIITNIQSYSIHDGPGIRTVIFLKGCPLKCRWCCNPETQNPKMEVEFFKLKCVRCGLCQQACDKRAINPDLEVKLGLKIDKSLCDECGKCVAACPAHALRYVGEKVSADHVLDRVKQDRVFYIWSKGGVTLSGGEPLHQFDFTKEVLRRCFDENIQTAIETCGFVPWRLYEDVLRHLDLVLYDLKHMDPIKHKKLTGVSNELILENLKRISNHGVPIIIRLPLIPQFNTDQANMIRTADFVSTVKNVSEINLLPFHQYGKDKYYRLSRPYELGFLEGLSVSEKGLMDVREIKRLFESRGLKVLVGG